MASRRGFLQTALAAFALPSLTWADAGNPSYLSAAKRADGRYALFGLDGAGQIRFSIPLPTRGHAAAAHPTRPVAVAFARRPGTYAIALDCVTGAEIAKMQAPEGHHFYGHGVFSADGNTLFTTENHIETGVGIIGVWENYQRIGAFPSNGIGPHEILRLPGTDTLIVANGGIHTHPDTGRAKLNINTMQPNLSYLSPLGDVLEMLTLPHSKNSIRHIAVRSDGLVGMAMQWQGNVAEVPPLLALHRMGVQPVEIKAAPAQHRWLKGYAGSIAFAQNSVGITSPRGGVAQVFAADTGALQAEFRRPDICGLAPHGAGFIATDGLGHVVQLNGETETPLSHDPTIFWDNHLISIS
ncbi:MAG: DUF1513 domain-containing protein [Rhodobacteraceae bacterium]|nr:DUF1513 domain-containing protein [Paracoccaceae bacterium]